MFGIVPAMCKNADTFKKHKEDVYSAINLQKWKMHCLSKKLQMFWDFSGVRQDIYYEHRQFAI